ncbi:MAG: hypothetical protein E7335_03280 [Clostridiales bacterium]|nr:hypothetical protein [Clostridiales bacterium]
MPENEALRSEVSRDQYEGRTLMCDERFRRDKERIDRNEDEMRRVRELTVQMGEMIKRHDSQIEGHERRLMTLEKQPSEQFGKIKTAAITAIVTGLVGLAVNAIWKLG